MAEYSPLGAIVGRQCLRRSMKLFALAAVGALLIIVTRLLELLYYYYFILSKGVGLTHLKIVGVSTREYNLWLR